MHLSFVVLCLTSLHKSWSQTAFISQSWFPSSCKGGNKFISEAFTQTDEHMNDLFKPQVTKNPHNIFRQG